VDYERGRTKQEWVPRKFGGGKGEKRRDRETERLIRELKKSEALQDRPRSAERAAELKNVKVEPQTASVKEESKGASNAPTQTAPNEAKKNGSEAVVKEEAPVERSRSRSRDGKKDRKRDHHHRHHHSSSSESDYHSIHRHKDSKKESKKDSKRDRD
jgi:U1 small nuclear ribonucleoprotein